MKKIIFVLAVLFVSCNDHKGPNYIPEIRMEYIKILSTGLCYSKENGVGYTMCCVPCDSLKNVEVKIYK